MTREMSDQEKIEPEVVAETEGDDTIAAASVNDTTATSLHSSVQAYHEENGRTYHALSAGKYFIPNDQLEIDRLDLQHNLCLLTLDDRLALCPKNEGAKQVLDLGCGSGVWALEYAERHPDAQVMGVDLSPIQPPFVPPNLSFEIDDVEKDWAWGKNFDFIYARMLGGSFSDPQAMVQKCYDNLEPGGYLEMWDMGLPVTSDDGSLSQEHNLSVMSHMTVRAAQALGRPIDKAHTYKTIFEAAGFEDVQLRRYKWPSNEWPRDKKYKKMGLWNLAQIDSGLEGLTLALFTRGLGLSKEETLEYCKGARREIRDPRIHAYWPMYICYGKRPEKGKAT